MLTVHYAYPTSPIGGKDGCYYVQDNNSKTRFDTADKAILHAVSTGRKVRIDFGTPESFTSWLADNRITHAMSR